MLVEQCHRGEGLVDRRPGQRRAVGSAGEESTPPCGDRGLGADQVGERIGMLAGVRVRPRQVRADLAAVGGGGVRG